jgi:RNA polymerase sigma-70 factor (ECF subfamily)
MRSWAERRDLILRAQRGDRQAFDDLVSEYRRSVEAFISHAAGPALRRRLDVDDLLQETLIRAFRSLPDFEDGGEDGFKSWLFTVARHAIQDMARALGRQKRDVGREVSLAGGSGEESGTSAGRDPGLASPDPSPSKGPERQERFERLKEALSTLSPEHRQVIHLARLDGLRIEDVAERMGRSKEATSMLLLRAMRKLKVAFGSTESFGLPPWSLGGEGMDDGERH